MSKTVKLTIALVAATLVLPAAAGSWPPTPPRKAGEGTPAAVRVAKAEQPRTVGGFEYVGGEAGWQLAQHKYDFVNGKFAMSDECDHAIRTAQAAPTPAQLDATRRQSPGS